MKGYWDLCCQIVALVLPPTLRGLGLPDTAGAHFNAGRNGVLRLLHYPVVPD